jgi:hypothetical protein
MMMLIDATVVIEHIRLLDCVCVCVCVCFVCVVSFCQKPVFLSMNIATIILLNCCCYLKSCDL